MDPHTDLQPRPDLFCSEIFLFKIFQVSFLVDLQELLESLKTFFMVDSVFRKEQETC